jgi:hypothetical protein
MPLATVVPPSTHSSENRAHADDYEEDDFEEEEDEEEEEEEEEEEYDDEDSEYYRQVQAPRDHNYAAELHYPFQCSHRDPPPFTAEENYQLPDQQQKLLPIATSQAPEQSTSGQQTPLSQPGIDDLSLPPLSAEQTPPEQHPP